jgi:hypothetical protein
MPEDEINCHWVSESLTKPWERTLGNRKELYFYAFSTKAIHSLPSKDLFARRGLNTRAVEDWLSDTIEAPLGRFRKALRKQNGTVPAHIDDLAAYRALLMLLPLQVTRLAKVKSSPRTFEQIFEWPKSKLDDYVQALRSEYSVIIVQAHRQAPLFFTENGFFMLPFPGASLDHAAAMAMPLNEYQAVVALPRSMDRSLVSSTLAAGDGLYLNNCSIGTNANRVVIHPGVIEAMKEDDLIAELEAARSRNRACYKESLQFVSIVSQALACVETG